MSKTLSFHPCLEYLLVLSKCKLLLCGSQLCLLVTRILACLNDILDSKGYLDMRIRLRLTYLILTCGCNEQILIFPFFLPLKNIQIFCEVFSHSHLVRICHLWITTFYLLPLLLYFIYCTAA